MKNREYKEQILRENYNEYIENGSDNITLREYVECEAENDPNFFAFVFSDGNIEKFSDLSEEQKNDYAELLNLLDAENKRINR